VTQSAEVCIFCRIVAGEAPSSVVYRDHEVVAFMAVPQSGRGHVLVVPREHAATCFELRDDLAGLLFRTAVRIARAVNGLYRPDGVSLVQNNGAAAGQSVFHVHLHVLPRMQGVRVRIGEQGWSSERAELDRMAAEIAAALEGG
jgi:histidine triad (HIT) family protein